MQIEVELVLSSAAVCVACLGLFHTVVVVPLRSQIILTNESVLANTSRIHSLEIDHAKLTVTLDNLTKAIDRLTAKFEKV